MDEQPQSSVNFTIVPEDAPDFPRIYANFCAIQNSPFDFSLTFCEMMPVGEKEIREAQKTRTVRAPVRAKLVVPVQMIPGLIGALQENFRLYQQSFGPPAGQVN
jgi:hypothetical protein